MNLDELDEMLTGTNLTWQELLSSVIILAVGCFVSYLVGRWRHKRLGQPDGQSQQVIGLVARVAQVLVVAVFAGWALTRLGSDIGFLTVTVIVALLIAVLAARPILEGMGASAALTTRPAFGVGDEIGVDDIRGEVIEITNRSTVIRMRDSRRVHVPNVQMLSKTVTVYSIEGERRSAVDVMLGFETDIDRAEQVIRDALGGVDAINRVGSIRAVTLTGGVELSVRFWHPSGLEEQNDALDAAVRTIKSALEDEHIVISPPAEVALIDQRTNGT